MTEVRAFRLHEPKERSELQQREEGARMRAVQLLANPDTAAAIRRFSLDGVDLDSSNTIDVIRRTAAEKCDTLLHTELSNTRVEFAAALLKHARQLKELRFASLTL